jgi:hypothetical protein
MCTSCGNLLQKVRLEADAFKRLRLQDLMRKHAGIRLASGSMLAEVTVSPDPQRTPPVMV